MMGTIEFVNLFLSAILCAICSRSDLKSGIVRNRTLGVFLLFAIILDAVCYGYFARDLLVDFAVNVFVVFLASLVLFYTHSFAGGDCKMAIVLATLFPAKCYLVVWGYPYTLLLALALALATGYCYLLARALWGIASGKATMAFDYVKDSLLSFLKTYVAAMSYILLIGCVAVAFSKVNLEVNVWALRILCMLTALCVGRFCVLRSWLLFSSAAALAVVLSVAMGAAPVTLNPSGWLLVLILFLCQTTIKTSLYENIKVNELEKGMILSTISSLPMQASITRNLPGISTENLRSRLSEEEVASVKIWAKATHTETLTVVKKMPFAIFITAGYFLYGFLWAVSV